MLKGYPESELVCARLSNAPHASVVRLPGSIGERFTLLYYSGDCEDDDTKSQIMQNFTGSLELSEYRYGMQTAYTLKFRRATMTLESV